MTSFYGSVIGNIIGTLYFLFFQLTGIVLVHLALHRKNIATRLLTGSVMGSVLLQWLPALFAFFLDFSVAAHLFALLACIFLIITFYILKKDRLKSILPDLSSLKILLKTHRYFLLLSGFTFILYCIMLFSHTLSPAEDGLHTGQCTYGDMQMHLGFITSIARQQTFPPFYSISPGDRLCYPFLCDSISSSIYIWGASLRYAYMLPMFVAFLQAMFGFYALSYEWLRKPCKALLAWFFFFYNGGLGFVYFFDWTNERVYYFKNIFTEYYQTPTNLIGNNIRWVNIIADMLLPQRATLFGYAVLFTTIWLLWRCVFNKENDLFLITALLTAALPMIHTHSFLAMGLISAAWLLMQLYNSLMLKQKCKYPGQILLISFLFLMCLLSFLNGNEGRIDSSRFLGICLIGILGLLMLGIFCLCLNIRKYGIRPLLSTWGIYLIIILVLSLPQLFFWTFSQASNSGFNTGHFNWANLGDHYIWFYIKNWGIILVLLIPAVMYCNRKNFAVISASFLIWFVVELISFSPNTYDNNKLLYVSYALLCCLCADYGYEIYYKTKAISGIKIWCWVFLFLSCFSAILTLGREIVSDYTAYSNSHVKAALYIDENLSTDATFLTNDRHVNEVSALTGRNIVSGAGVFLGPHGIYDNERAEHVKMMFEAPLASEDLFHKYQVDYIVISSWERSNFALDEALFDASFPCIFSYEDIKIYEYR